MIAATHTRTDIAFANELLLLPDQEHQAAFLQKAALLNQAGLTQLLDVAMELARSDPGQAQQLTVLCANLAGRAGVPAILPKATYIRAQTHAVNGELNKSLELIQEARDGYVALGEALSALRTNLGLMHVLIQLGRYREALDVGRALLEQLANGEWAEGPEAGLIATLAHNNLGLCCWRMGRYEDALAAFAAAEKRGLSGGLADRLGDIRNNRGIILMYLGRAGEALEAFQASAALYAETGLTLLHGQTLINMGEAYLLLGDYSHSLETLAQAQHALSSIGAEAEEHLALLHRADVYLALNLYPEALADYRQADSYYKKAGMPHYQAQVRWGMGAALMAQAQLAPAEAYLSQSAALFEAAGNAPFLCSVMLEQATLQAVRGQHDLALATARQAYDLVAAEQWPAQQCYAHLRLADLLSSDEAVEAHLLQAQGLLEKLALPHLRYRLLQRLGQLRRRQGRSEEAQRLLIRAVDEIERLRGTVAQEAMRTSFLADKVAAYEELLQLYLDHGNAEQAFAVGERAKSRALIDLLTGIVAARPLPASVDAQSRLQRLQAELNAVYNQFLGSSGNQEQPAAFPELTARAQELEQEINRLHLQAPAEAGMRPDLLTTTFTYDAIRDQLASDLYLLAYHLIGDEIVAFVSSGDGLEVVRPVSTVTAVQELQQRLTRQWDRFRAGRDFAQRHMPRLEQSTRRVLAALYDELMAPVIALLGERQVRDGPGKVAIVPHGLLHHVPFHALYDGERYLLERFEIAYAPSATVLALCQARNKRPIQRALVAGVSDPLIPAVQAEVQAVARHLPSATVQLEEQATLAAWQAHAPAADVLHLACHGLFRADNPMFSALKLYDGWLTAADVRPLHLNGALVTLSACESGRSQAVAGDEVMGLTRAFLSAGAATVAVSLWLVQDDTTAELMAGWYAQLQERPYAGPASALRTAQLRLKAKYAHPYYWAPFVLVGRR